MKHIKIKAWVKILIVFIIIITLTTLYSRYIGTKGLVVNEKTIVDSNLPNNYYGLKIIHLSDIHYKKTTTKKDLEKIVKEINLLKPDIVIFSGDLLDSSITYKDTDYKDLKEILNSINYNIGKYAIKGENDLEFDKWNEIINDSNFINLNDNYELIYNNGIEPILLVGISSNYKNNHIEDTINDIYSKLNTEYKYSILVLHEPDFINYIDYNKFNLILAGHSHSGQIRLPFIGGIINQKYASTYKDEYYMLGNTNMYISSGIGTSKYKFRLFDKPSFNLYRLRNK